MRIARLLPFLSCARTILAPATALGSMACLAVIASGCHRQSPRPPSPAIDELSASLARTADKAFAPPSLTNDQVSVAATPGRVDEQTAGILADVTAAGGAGVRSQDDAGNVSILATIPENNAEAFKAALLRNEKPAFEKPASGTRLIQVTIVNQKPAPSPAP